jgi:hypothetical protein
MSLLIKLSFALHEREVLNLSPKDQAGEEDDDEENVDVGDAEETKESDDGMDERIQALRQNPFHGNCASTSSLLRRHRRRRWSFC